MLRLALVSFVLVGAPPPVWLKGQTHVHSSRSPDGKSSPEAMAKWYAQHGFDFIVFTDHNVITTLPPVDGMLVIAGVEITQNLATCEPPSGQTCNLHINALFVDPKRELKVYPPKSNMRSDVYAAGIDAALKLGGIAQLNHPNFRWGAGVPELVAAARRGALLVEVANEASDSDNAGDEKHPSTRSLLKAALDAGVRLYPVASDDAHHESEAGRGWIRVKAKKDPASIRAAIERGDFFAELADGGRL